jgi:Uma2 family endonuclease
MSTIHRTGPGAAANTNPIERAPLHDGQRLDSAAFLALYEQTAPGVKAELIGGVVHMGSPVGYGHGDAVKLMALWVGYYEARTPGVTGSCDATSILDDQGVPQPDVSLRILPGHGGQTHYVGKLIGGAPELVVEVADSSRPVDLGSKLADYERAGVLEYIVVALDPDEVYWHVRRNDRLERIAPDPDGLYRSQAFPGLWLDPKAALSDDAAQMIAVLDRGLATAEHADFAAALDARVQG